MADKRSPLKDPPLRNPAQSLDDQIQDFTYDYMLWPTTFSFIFRPASCAGVVPIFANHPSVAETLYVRCRPILAFAAYRFCKGLPRLHALKLGRDGEKAVGQFLESLRERGYRVFHDVVGGNFNLDHVLIDPAGVFTVETKTHSKPNGDVRVTFDGETIRIDGFSRIEIRWFRRRHRRAGYENAE